MPRTEMMGGMMTLVHEEGLKDVGKKPIFKKTRQSVTHLESCPSKKFIKIDQGLATQQNLHGSLNRLIQTSILL